MAMRSFAFLVLLGTLALSMPARADLQKAHDDLAVTQSGQAVLVNVLANDYQLGPDLRILKAFKPAHGSVSVESGGIRYTPAAGYQGSDSFKYMAQSPKSQPGQATVSVEVGRGGVSLRLVGRVVDNPIPGALVRVSIGGFDFNAVADLNGNYVLDIAALRGDEFVTLSATGVSQSGAAVRFYSAVGEIVRLAAAAGTDGVLVRDEFNQVNITNLSTAQYTLLTEANGGAPVGSDQQLLPLVQNINLDQLLRLAAVIKLVVDEHVPLPAGTTDALALISDPAALQTFQSNLAPGVLAAAVTAVSQDTNLTPVFRAGALPSGYALLPPSAPGTIQPFTGVAMLAAFTGSAVATFGTGTNIDSNFASDSGMQWALDNGDLTVTPTIPYTAVYEDGASGPVCLEMDVRVSETEQGWRLHRLQDGAGVDYVQLTTNIHRHYENLNADGCVPPADADVSTTGLRLAFEDGAGELPFASNESFGKIALSQWVPSQNRWGAAVYDFDAHTVSVPGTASGFTSAVVNGRLQVTLTDNTLGAINYEYRRYQTDARKGEGVFTVTTVSGHPLASYNLASRANEGFGFAFGDMPGRWITGFDLAKFEGDGLQHFNGFSLVFRDGLPHVGNQRAFDANGVPDNHIGISWDINSGTFIARGYFDPLFGAGARNVATCVSPYPSCWQRRQRTWIPLSRDGNRVYVLETVVFSDAAGQPFVIGDGGQRVNFWELQAPDPNAYHAATLPREFALIPPAAPGTIFPFSGLGALLTLDGSAGATSGTGSLVDSGLATDPAITWALVAGDLQITPVVPYTLDENIDVTLGPTCTAYTDAGFIQHDIDRGWLIHRQQSGAGGDTLQIWMTVFRYYNDPDPADGCVPPGNGLVSTSVQRLAFADGNGELLFAPTESFGQFALTHWVPSQNRWGAAIYDFGTHTVSIPGMEVGFSSSVVGGRLNVQLTDSSTAQSTSYQFRRLQTDGRKGEGLFVVATLPGGARLAGYNLAARVDQSLAFNTANVPGTWRYGPGIAQTPRAPGDLNNFFVVYNGDAGQTGVYRLIGVAGDVFEGEHVSWNIESANVIARSYRDISLPPGMRQVGHCTSAYPSCWQTKERSWVPIAGDGNRIYEVETVMVNQAGPGGPLLTGNGAQRVNFHERQP